MEKISMLRLRHPGNRIAISRDPDIKLCSKIANSGRRNNSKGFTLIELLLVLTLLIIILGFAVLSLRQYAENARINKAALEIEQVLQAAITYHTNIGKWPKDNSTGTCMPDANSDFAQHYLPNGQAQSSFGYYYCWRAAGQNQQLFAVALQVPDNDSNLAKRVAAHLPNAIITSDPNNDSMHDCEVNQACFVKTEVAANTNTDTPTQMLIVGMGNCATGGKDTDAAQVPDQENCKLVTPPQDQTEVFAINFPACPSNYNPRPKIIVSPNFNTMPGINIGDYGLKFMRLKAMANYSSCQTDSNNQETCQINLQVQTCNHTNCQALDLMQQGSRSVTATIGASYVVGCVPNTMKVSKKILY